MDNLISRLSELRSQYSCFDENERGAYHALSEAIKVLQEQKTGKWIPVSERLPEKNGEYLVTVGKDSKFAINGEPTVYQDHFQFLCQWDDCGDDVIAWMPLPEPYTEEEQ